MPCGGAFYVHRLTGQAALPSKTVMDRISSWLCPTEHHRARALEANARVRTARTMAGATCGLSLLAMAPFMGWWFLGLFAASAAVLLTADRRIESSARPELAIALNGLVILALLAVGAALSGGEDSPALPWLVLPAALAAARFRPQVVIVGAALTAAAMFTVSVGVDAQGVVDDPTRLISTLTLLIAITAVMTALMESELEHRDRAVLDPLTGLLNRASLEARVLEIEEQAHLTGGAVSLILLDLDCFKAVNDTHGHKRGDAVLSDVAYEIRRSLRSFELVYRIGGEEFLLLLPGVDLTEALEIAERVRHAVQEARPGSLDLTLSAGVATGAGGHISYDELFRAADEALFEAKRGGRNRVETAGGLSRLAFPGTRQMHGDPSALRA
jgi:diguanylate cyclase (GGDEF)-like protein